MELKAKEIVQNNQNFYNVHDLKGMEELKSNLIENVWFIFE